jgi:anionic cell wall polymer biosynthesis LytR-Cps2A-Psr (LCP) family protein
MADVSRTKALAVVAVTDRRGWDGYRTDNLVVVDAWRRVLVWVPRDVWIPIVGDRINGAFLRGGFTALLGSLWYLGLPVTHGLVVNRAATERFADQLDVVVPVDHPLRFRYPIAPDRRLQDGAKIVEFEPPAARLTGERVHQWVGARYEVGRSGSDLRRVARQQVLLRVLLERGVSLEPVLDREDEIRRFRAPERVLGQVDPGWAMRTLGPLRDLERGGASVLATPSAPFRLAAHAWARVLRSPR